MDFKTTFVIFPAVFVMASCGGALAQITVEVAAPDTAKDDVNRRVFGGVYYDLHDKVDAYEQMGMGMCREGGPGFESPGMIQPREGTWNWGNFDHWLGWLAKKKVEGLPMLGGGVDWMCRGGGEHKPSDWNYFCEKWSDNAAAIVRHANLERKAGLTHWEIWNEADEGFWFGIKGGDPLGYSQLYLKAYAKMKAADPSIKIGTAGISDPFRGGLDDWWVPLVRDYGLRGKIDFLCLHGYYGDPANGTFAKGIDRARALMRKHLGEELPIWITEFNVFSDERFGSKGYPLPLQAVFVADYLGLFAAKDVEAAFYFCLGWWGSDYTPWGGPNGEARPVFFAYQWWKDYTGKRLEAKAEGADAVWAVACVDGIGRTIVYLPIRCNGPYTVRFGKAGGKGEVKIAVFRGDGVRIIASEEAKDGDALIVTFKIDDGARGIAKVILTPSSH